MRKRKGLGRDVVRVRLDPIATCTPPIIPTAINRCTRFSCKLDDSSKPTTGHRLSRDSPCECTFGPEHSRRASATKIVRSSIDDPRGSDRMEVCSIGFSVRAESRKGK
ncbi:hypothetical protein WN48_02247 [Eufriesea mexicana]|uniref:Uncharacterized protein n=1 Tax=Eufriesea mexicana TaxID=516756 RepID=A0A310SKL7_9HYME|nr:hypothetical protein WN48_02247 [Eufriesea mexicana]